MSRPSVTFVTGNRHKVEEVQAILNDTITIQAKALDIVEVQGSLEEITREKCRTAAEIIGGPVLVEDSALEMSALNGMPGPYVKAFLDTIGNEGLLKLLDPFEDKSADAVCTAGYSSGPGEKPILFQGRLKGRIVPIRELSAFGFEPILEFEGETLAEMDDEKKNKISHRYQAMSKFGKWLLENRTESKSL
ncbi:non-canonical purine NTP pyrophosphatase, rdgB/HAM1 family [Talaromyces proteolyticus]|uniref:Inosine triphosphate pyrophosphatase n=1 Tax=Talaromyces proteolyticus TaxID=1131652 RepID=A0AAD4Q2T8_9EURO|nr:non-canonical purine NTP pyrophosphatase, rdgB/HAM1 family [Talaromyces proteolyticus]KAH8700732.1 non-canonical purine NTP pyrophosphatase, rdgB/HAM1 family [Talaromyces proteolyticus]